MLLYLFKLVYIVVGDERLIRVELAECFCLFYGVGINDFIPYEVLPLFLREIFYIFIHYHEFGKRGDVEARAYFIKRLHYLRVGIGLDRVIGLDARESLLEGSIILPYRLVVD